MLLPTHKHTTRSAANSHPSLDTKTNNKLSIKTIASSREPSKISIAHRLITEPPRNQISVPHQAEWQVLYNRRQSYLNSLFNRRRSILESISRKNRQIYGRIVTQQSQYRCSKLAKDQSSEKNKATIQNLTEGSRIMLALSRQAMNKTNMTPHRLKPILQKQNNQIKIIEEEQPKLTKKMTSKMLCSILQKANTFNVNSGSLDKVVESRYIREDGIRGFNQMLVSSSQLRSKPGCVTKLNDIFTNF